MPRRVAAAFLLASALACRGAEEKLEDSRRAVASWSATLRKASADWARGDNPTRFTRTVFRAASDELASQAKKLERIGRDAPYAEVDRLEHAIERLKAIASRLDEAVEKNDHAAAVSADRVLEEIQRAFPAERS